MCEIGCETTVEYVSLSLLSTCINGALECGTEDCGTSVICPNNLVYRTDFVICGHTCETAGQDDMCMSNVPTTSGCFCEDDLLLSSNVSQLWSGQYTYRFHYIPGILQDNNVLQIISMTDCFIFLKRSQY